MRGAALVSAVTIVGTTACAAVRMNRGPDPADRLQLGAQAVQVQEFVRAQALLEPLYLERWSEPVGQRAMLTLVAAELDARNPNRSLYEGADIAARLLNVPDVESWMVPIAETFYLLAIELGAQEERLARADSALLAAQSRAAEAAASGRELPSADVESVPSRIARVERERDALKQQIQELNTQIAAKDKELQETKQELERIRRTIKH